MVPPTTTSPDAWASRPSPTSDEWIFVASRVGVLGTGLFAAVWQLASGADAVTAIALGAIVMILLGIPAGLAVLALVAVARLIARSAVAAARRRRAPKRPGRATPSPAPREFPARAGARGR